MTAKRTQLGITDLCCPELEQAVEDALTGVLTAGVKAVKAQCEERFQREMESVRRGIEARGRFQLLKRFIAHGSLLPAWEHKFTNSPQALNDDELAACMDFVLGHMVSKFQGKLAEMLAIAPLGKLVLRLKREGRLPVNGQMVFGNDIRCVGARSASDEALAGIEGPDVALVVPRPDGRFHVALIGEIKSYRISTAKLRKQSENHVKALQRGFRLQGRWVPLDKVTIPERRSSVIKIYVQPSRWRLERAFRISPDSNGVGQIVMEHQSLPAQQDSDKQLRANEWQVQLGWSCEPLRAAAFRLMHRYMREVGEAIAADPQEKIRQDMSPKDAGENDFLAQMHVAIFRQQQSEPNGLRWQKSIELYNVLGFGWAIGHNFRDKDGDPAMIFDEDLRDMAGTTRPLAGVQKPSRTAGAPA